MRFLDVKTDFAFKKVFGSEGSKNILMSFLNSVIDFPDEGKITDLTIVDPYQIPIIRGMKDTFVDVKAVLSNGKRVIIEMQVLNVAGFEKRILYNAAKSYSTQISKSEEFKGLEPIIALTITDFIMFPEIEGVISCFKLMEKETLVQYSDDIELIFIELPKFKKEKVEELTDIAEKWIYFIKEAGSLEYIPETFDKELKDAFNVANTAGLSREEEEAQFKRRDFIWLQKGSLDLALEQGMQQGMEKGMEKGIEKGIEKGMEKALSKLVESGMSEEKAKKILGLS